MGISASKHGENLIKLTRLRAVNCYLVREADGLTLIDTAISGTANAIMEAAADAGAPIVRVTLTHAHNDHTGSLEALVDRLGDIEIAFGAREARFLAGDSSLDADEPDHKPRGMVSTSVAPSRRLTPGDRVGSLEVVAAPGHSPGQIAFLDTRDRTLIAGDAFATIGGVSVTSRIYPRFPLPGLVTWDRAAALRTARELRALEPARLAVGHGRVVEAPAAEMDRAITRVS